MTAVSASQRGHARLPFMGIAEAYVLNAFRRAGVPTQRIRPSLDWLVEQVGPQALASKDLYTDGAEVLWKFAQRSGEDSPAGVLVKHLIVPRSGQYVCKEIVQHYLEQISVGDDKFANVGLDPRRGYGQPVCGNSGVAEDYGVPVSELHDALDLSA